MAQEQFSSHNHPFYGVDILRARQQEYVNQILKKHKKRKADEALYKEIYDELQREKALGNLTMPFKVALRKDPTKTHPDYIEVILDTKV
jgi:hypothetical protein